MSKILIIGGNGKVAMRLAPILVEQGEELTSLFRNPDHTAEVADTGATPVVQDIAALSTTEMAELMRGFDAIVWSAGAGGGAAERTYAIDRDAAIRSMDAATQAGVKRYVMMSYLRARAGHGVAPDQGFYPYIESKRIADDYLRASDLDYTIVAGDILSLDEPTGKINRVLIPAETTYVPRGDVAATIAAVLKDDSTIGTTLDICGGETPITEAIQG
ncbi:SDR family oxidoreductase [Corynebacterium callunae]|uniref:SDR family oxidoreductase n=1 Tax=Corynebacterium callunae TaxID=1721 RepID=UPI00398235C9